MEGIFTQSDLKLIWLMQIMPTKAWFIDKLSQKLLIKQSSLGFSVTKKQKTHRTGNIQMFYTVPLKNILYIFYLGEIFFVNVFYAVGSMLNILAPVKNELRAKEL